MTGPTRLAVGLHGAAGRMGQAIARALAQREDMAVVSAMDAAPSRWMGKNLREAWGDWGQDVVLEVASDEAVARCDVVIDFSLPAGTESVARLCENRGTALVVGTTGLTDGAEGALVSLARRAPVVVASNMSVGVHVLFFLARRAAELLGDGYDPEIVEMHHRRKVDSPSGTALSLARAVQRGRGWTGSVNRSSREGACGPRPQQEIGVMALRGGDVVGDHTVIFAGDLDRVELSHRAQSREVFASGAVRASQWVVGRAPGRYGMAEVLGLR